MSKSFGAVAALRGGHLELRVSEAHALVGGERRWQVDIDDFDF